MIRQSPIVVLLLASLPLSAQDNPRNTIDFGTLTPGPGPVTRTLAGDFTEDWEPDVILLDNGVPKLSYASYLFDAATQVEPSLVNVADIAALRGVSAEGREVLLATDATGLLAVTYSDITGTFNPPVVVAAGGWANASPLVSTVDPSGVRIVFGIDGTDTLLTLVEVGGILVPGPTFTTAEPVLEFEALDWDADGRLELVFRSALGLEVREMDGTLIQDIGGPDLGALAVVRDGNGDDFLAWAKRTLPEAFYRLELINATNWNAPTVNVKLRVPEEPGVAGSPLLDLDIRSITAGDPEDGGTHLLLTHATNQSAYLLRDTDSGPDITYAPKKHAHRYGRSSNPLDPALGHVAPSSILQLNNNGGLDLAVVTNEDRELRIYVDPVFPPISSVTPAVAVASASQNLEGGEGSSGATSLGSRSKGSGVQYSGGKYGIIAASYDVFGPNPEDYFLDLNLPPSSTATHLQVTVWDQVGAMFSPVGVQENTVFPLGLCTGSSLHTALLSLPSSLGLNPAPYYYFQYRMVEVSGDQILSASESHLGVCGLETFPGEFQNGGTIRFLENNLEAENPLPVQSGGYTCTSLPDGGAILGVIYSDSLPPFPPIGTTPNPGPWQVVQINTINH